MAMGRRGRDEAERSIRNRRPFTNSTGSMRGTRGSTTDLGWLRSHSEARKIRTLLERAVYVIWSYDTPIGFVSADEDGDETNYYVDESHSATTGAHQGILRVAFSDFESIGSGPWARSQGARRGIREWAAGRRPTPGQMAAEAQQGLATWRAEQERIDRRAGLAPVPATSYATGQAEDRQRASMEQMLDPRYANPDWTPWSGLSQGGGNLPEGAEERDAQRVAAEGEWRP